MVYKSLILGILFGIGIFAVKSGVGLAYVCGRQSSSGRRAATLSVFAGLYGLVFLAMFLLLGWIDPVGHLPAIQRFLQSGMLVHLAMAGLMAGWGK